MACWYHVAALTTSTLVQLCSNVDRRSISVLLFLPLRYSWSVFCCRSKVTPSLRCVYTSRLLWSWWLCKSLYHSGGVQPFCLDAGLCRHELCSLFLLFSRVHSAEYYMQEAKRLKHKADALVRCWMAPRFAENQSGNDPQSASDSVRWVSKYTVFSIL